ncbi:MAG TPA: TonB-dependent receptor [Terracidiphilus sp.]|nr:TonB-dependent receptor [Terracidiphilus sp.]
MAKQQKHPTFRLVLALISLCFPALALATEVRGVVIFNALPVPGATVTVTHDATQQSTVTDQNGVYTFDNLSDGNWKIEIAMDGFATVRGDVTVVPGMPAGKWELTLLPLDKLLAMSTERPASSVQRPASGAEGTTSSSASPAVEIPSPESDTNRDSDDGFLVNGSVNNAATSQYALEQAFGNRRPGSMGLYNGGFAAILDNSALDARPYSLSGFASPKPTYDRITGVATVGGPIRIPHVLPRGPTFFFAYQGTRDHDAATETGLVPTQAERAGNLSALLNAFGAPVTIFDPVTGLPFMKNIVPVSPQARVLLQLYPLPNIARSLPYNYQIPVLNSSHQDVVQLRLDKTVGHRDQLYGRLNLQSTREGNANLFGFVDSTATLGIDTTIHWSHRFAPRMFLNAGYNFSRLRTLVRPEFENGRNISGEAGITGNDQDPADWGPPALSFASGFAALSDAQSAFNRNRTDGVSLSALFFRGNHYVTIGGDFRKQEYNEFFQQDPRGTFTFTGAATAGPVQNVATAGSDLADFLIGVPDTSSLAFGNAGKYLRQPVYDAYFSDDWRLKPDLTINAGARWEYGAPMTELYGRLVNLDVAPDFAAVAPVLGSHPLGSITGQHYPASLMRPDRLGFEPRIGISWRPLPASTLVVRAGYGVYHDTSVYLNPMLQMAQQAPLSKSLRVQNSAACPLSLANGFASCATITPDSFAIDPNFRVGYAQTWNLGIQRDLPGALQANITYLGVKGTRGVQEFLPNTYPIGAANPCPSCPSGFAYRTSGGDSTRQSGQVQLRRRLRNGFTATALYTFSRSLDDDAFLGGQGYVSTTQQNQNLMQVAPPVTAAIAQNWRNLQAERALSTFDQRHLLTVTGQYTSGEGQRGGDLLSGWAGRLLKEWTLAGEAAAGSGLPETPVYLAAVPGAGYTGTIRPSRTNAPISTTTGARHLNSAAFSLPAPGQWGTAGRDSITGPRQFTLNSSLARTFRPGGKWFLDARIDATNVLNHTEFTNWNTTVNSAQFGLPLSANAMRSLQTTVRLRF